MRNKWESTIYWRVSRGGNNWKRGGEKKEIRGGENTNWLDGEKWEKEMESKRNRKLEKGKLEKHKVREMES